MTLKKSCAIFVTVFLLLAAIAPSLLADSPANDACLLLTQAQVSDALGAALGAGSHVNAQFLKTCTWTPTGPAKDVKAVTLNIQDGNTYDSAKKHIELAATAGGGGTRITPATGIGDDAYYFTASPTITSLFFKKGTSAFKIAIYGAPSQKAITVEKALALEVISKL